MAVTSLPTEYKFDVPLYYDDDARKRLEATMLEPWPVWPFHDESGKLQFPRLSCVQKCSHAGQTWKGL